MQEDTAAALFQMESDGHRIHFSLSIISFFEPMVHDRRDTDVTHSPSVLSNNENEGDPVTDDPGFDEFVVQLELLRGLGPLYRPCNNVTERITQAIRRYQNNRLRDSWRALLDVAGLNGR